MAGPTLSRYLGLGLLIDALTASPTPRVTATMTRPGQATTYTIGDIIANSQTAASVVPIEFTLPAYTGRISGARCVVTAASGTIVLPAFDLILFNPASNIPFAAAGYPADNAALEISAAAYREAVAVIPFASGSWRNKDGASSAAGATIRQEAILASSRTFAPFNTTTTATKKLLGLLQVQNAWNPGNVAQQFDFELDIDSDAA